MNALLYALVGGALAAIAALYVIACVAAGRAIARETPDSLYRDIWTKGGDAS